MINTSILGGLAKPGNCYSISGICRWVCVIYVYLLHNCNYEAPWDGFCCSVTQSCLAFCDPHGLQHTRPLCLSSFLRACSNSCPFGWWCHPTILPSVVPLSSCLHSFPELGSFLMSWLFTSGGQNIGVSASASVLSMNIQGWFPLGLIGLISLQSKGLSGVFSNAAVQKHQFFSAQPSLWDGFNHQIITFINKYIYKIYTKIPSSFLIDHKN